MPRRTARRLSLLIISVAVALGASAPARAFTPPLGSDKGSVTSWHESARNGIVVVKEGDASTPY
jgi:hypothetical protein